MTTPPIPPITQHNFNRSREAGKVLGLIGDIEIDVPDVDLSQEDRDWIKAQINIAVQTSQQALVTMIDNTLTVSQEFTKARVELALKAAKEFTTDQIDATLKAIDATLQDRLDGGNG